MQGRTGTVRVRRITSGAVLTAVFAILAAANLASGQSAVSDVTYTNDADFDMGTLVNVNHDPPFNNELKLNAETSTFPFIWVALSQRCTIAKIDTQSGDILGEYRTLSDGSSCPESSRTTVALDGSVWVGHRFAAIASHVGLLEANQCIDRNGNGSIDTSSGYGDVKSWPGANTAVSNAQDECITHHLDVRFAPYNFGDTRHMTIDASNNLWVGDFAGGHKFMRVNGSTGNVEFGPRTFGCGGYGGLIDGNGVIWSANGSQSGLLRWDPNASDSETNPRCIPINNYGLAVDPNGFIWATTLGSEVYKVSPDGNVILGPFPHGSSSAQGLAVTANGDVWVSSSLFCTSNCTVGHLKNNGTFVGNVPNPTGAGSTGVAVDAAGKVWTANRASHTATRIDPAAGPTGADLSTPRGEVDLTVNFPATEGRPQPFPYNYSDMTGNQLLRSTAPQGTWTVVQDGGAPGTQWGQIIWNTEARGSQPPGTQLIVEVRAADTQAGLGSQPFITVSNGAPFSLTGRFLEVRVTLRPDELGNGPILSDIRVCAQGGCQAEAAQPPTGEEPAAERPRRPRARVSGVPTRCTRANFSTRVRVNAAAGVRRVRVTLDGRRLMTTRRARFNLRVPARRLRSGRHRLTVVVEDRRGRRARISRTFRRCPRPPRQAPAPVFTG